MASFVQQPPQHEPFSDMNSLLQYISKLQPIRRQRTETFSIPQNKRRIDSTLFSWKKKDEMTDYYDNLTRIKNEQNGIKKEIEVDNSKALILYVDPSSVVSQLANDDVYTSENDIDQMEMCDMM